MNPLHGLFEWKKCTSNNVRKQEGVTMMEKNWRQFQGLENKAIYSLSDLT